MNRPIWDEAPDAHVRTRRDVTGVVVLDNPGLMIGEHGSELSAPPRRDVRPRGILGTGLNEDRDRVELHRRIELCRDHPLVVKPNRHDVGAAPLEQIDEGREAGVLHNHPVTEAHHLIDDSRQCIKGPIDDGQAARFEGPCVMQEPGELGKDWIIEVARRPRQRTRGDPLERLPQRWQELRIRRTSRQVKAIGPGGRPDAEVSRRQRRLEGGLHEGPGASACLDGPDRAESLPRLAHGRRAHPEVAGELADCREPIARIEPA